MPSDLPYRCTASATCIASSRVGHEDERACVRGRGVCVGRDAMQQRERERRGLAGAGRRLAEHVAAGEQRRNRLALDGCRLLVAERGERGDEARVEAECGEAGGRS